MKSSLQQINQKTASYLKKPGTRTSSAPTRSVRGTKGGRSTAILVGLLIVGFSAVASPASADPVEDALATANDIYNDPIGWVGDTYKEVKEETGLRLEPDDCIGIYSESQEFEEDVGWYTVRTCEGRFTVGYHSYECIGFGAHYIAHEFDDWDYVSCDGSGQIGEVFLVCEGYMWNYLWAYGGGEAYCAGTSSGYDQDAPRTCATIFRAHWDESTNHRWTVDRCE